MPSSSRSLQRIVDEGLSPVVSFERFSGNPFSGGYDSKEIADRLVQVFPDARVLVVVREQRSMIVSTYKQYVREGGALPPSKFMLPPDIEEPARAVVRPAALRVPPPARATTGGCSGRRRCSALAYEQFVADPRVVRRPRSPASPAGR